MMDIKLACIVVVAALSSQAFADKPAGVGQGKPSDAQKAEQRAAIQNKGKPTDVLNASEIELKTEKAKQNSGAKQHDNKTLEAQKELDKGSEQGQVQREKRKKWWRFWGDE